MYMDGASNERCSGDEVVLVTPEEHSICYALKLDFPVTNNETEYEALIAGLKIAKEMGLKTLHNFCSSQLVVCQVRKEFQAKRARLAPYLNRILELSMTSNITRSLIFSKWKTKRPIHWLSWSVSETRNSWAWSRWKYYQL